MNTHQLHAKISAIELLLFSLVKMQPAFEFRESYFAEKESMLAGLTPNPTASDEMYDEIQQILREYERVLCIKEAD